jgi:hypothetical protein
MQKRTVPTQKKESDKSRSVVPIPETIERIKGYPDKLILFKVPASPFWWVRYHDSRPIKRSTKTQSKQEAIRFAKQFYESVLVNNALGHSNNAKAKSFVLCADALIREDEEKRKRGELSDGYVRTQKNIINKHIKAFFKSYELAYPADIVLHSPGRSMVLRELRRIWAIAAELPRCDVVHYNAGTTIASAYAIEFNYGDGIRGVFRQIYAAYLRGLQRFEWAYVRWLGKAVFVTFQGDDAR